MPLSTRFVVFALLSLPVGAALAQTSPAPDTATLLKKIEEQDRRIEALEHKLEVLESQQAAAAAAGGQQVAGPAGAGQQTGGQAGAQQGQSGAGQVAGQPGAQQAAGQPGKPKTPPVPITTGALPGSPSTAVQGATAAVSQRAGTANEAPGLVSAGSIKAGPTGFSIASADGSNVIRDRKSVV